MGIDLRTTNESDILDWITGTQWRVGQEVVESGQLYTCAIDHVSGVFATDLGTGKWVTAGLPTAAQVKSLYESNADTNAFNDAEQVKVAEPLTASKEITQTLTTGANAVNHNLTTGGKINDKGDITDVSVWDGDSYERTEYENTDNDNINIPIVSGTFTDARIEIKYRIK